MSNFNFWKFLSFLLIILIILVSKSLYAEYKKNLIYKKEFKNIQRILNEKKELNLNLEKFYNNLKNPLNLEKERKDKLGEKLEKEKVIIISDDILKAINLPFLSE